jgi:hypothetical protein
MRIALVVALVVMASACSSKKEPALTSGNGSAGSGTASSDPWAKPAAPPADAAETPCTDADIQAHIGASLKVSLAYLAALEAKAKTWGTNCDRAMKDLIALEPHATKFMDSMKEFMTWGRSLSPTCAQRVQELGDQRPETKDIEARTPSIEAKVKPILEKCQNHPGFADAAAKGLRVMHRKQP